MRGPLKKLEGTGRPSKVEMSTGERVAEAVLATAAVAAASYCAYKGVSEVVNATTSVEDGIGLAVNGRSIQWAGKMLMAGALGGWAGSRVINRVKTIDKSPDNRRTAMAVGALGVVTFALGAVVPSASAAESADSVPPTATTAPNTPPTVVTNPPEGQGTVTTLGIPTTEGSFSAACELTFADDGDGFIQGDKVNIGKFQLASNTLGFGPFEVDGTLSGADLELAQTVKDAAINQLGDSYIPGPQGQFNAQMCAVLFQSIPELNDGDLATPQLPAGIVG